MLLPISDDNSDRHRTPFINYLFILINVLVFVFLQGMGSNYQFTYAFSTVPAEIIMCRDYVTESTVQVIAETGQEFFIPGLQPTPIHVYLTTITSMFMHGDWAHLLFNMLFLWIFGDNIENRLGHLRYILFYLLCGVIASLSHVAATFFSPSNPLVPSLGASGAISAVLGAYLFLFPGRRVKMILLYVIVSVPAWVTLGLWIALQVVNGLGILGGGNDGVAYAAHIGGFVAGMLLIKTFDKAKPAAGEPVFSRYIKR